MIRGARQLIHARRGASTLTALFLLVWLNMALQPCLMAAEPLLPEQTTHDCPHCPQPADHCEEDTARCGFIGDFDFDGRSPESPEPLPGIVAAWGHEYLPLPSDAAALPRAARATLPRAGPRLHARNCVYLN